MNFLNLVRRATPPRATYGRIALFADADGVVKTIQPDGTVAPVAGDALPDTEGASEGDALTLDAELAPGWRPNGGSQPFTGWTQDESDPANVTTNGGRLGGLPEPDDGADAATKDYVDNTAYVPSQGTTLDTGGGDVDTSGGNVSGAAEIVAPSPELALTALGGFKSVRVEQATGNLGFFGVAPVGPQEVPAVPTVQDVLNVLLAFGLAFQDEA